MVNICFVQELSHFCLFYFTTVFPSLFSCFLHFLLQLNILHHHLINLSPSILLLLKLLLPLFHLYPPPFPTSSPPPPPIRPKNCSYSSSSSSHNSSYFYSSSSSSLPSSSPQVLSTGPGSVPLLLDHSTLQKATVPTMSRVTAARSCHCKLR